MGKSSIYLEEDMYLSTSPHPHTHSSSGCLKYDRTGLRCYMSTVSPCSRWSFRRILSICHWNMAGALNNLTLTNWCNPSWNMCGTLEARGCLLIKSSIRWKWKVSRDQFSNLSMRTTEYTSKKKVWFLKSEKWTPTIHLSYKDHRTGPVDVGLLSYPQVKYYLEVFPNYVFLV